MNKELEFKPCGHPVGRKCRCEPKGVRKVKEVKKERIELGKKEDLFN